ncbi:hypothetical protein NHX12_033839 [Muraenolepis orangiensis]|uniref:E-selectin n=1 Tax=Muraenolepis orangiensis TaxID=630683 RepID=A0A9Q0E6R6_9TELE|nr:hypothetical protein NHX12_033839 [Muraenolepis orangiensis]
MKCTLILFTCYLVGRAHGWTYHTTTKLMNWAKARQWCQANYTDMVAIQSQRENDHLVSLLPNLTGSPYYWIGITRSHIRDPWTWVGNNSTWIGDQSWAANEPNNNHSTEFCVEIYVNHNRDNRGKWNDEKCGNRKFPVCYQAQCHPTSCKRGRCGETINNFVCFCEPGFGGDRCQTVVGCPPPSQLLYGHLNCSDSQSHAFNSTCRLGCSSGFLLLRSAQITCSSDGNWRGPRPICTKYEHAAMALAACGALGIISCIFFVAMKRRKNLSLIGGVHAWTYHYSTEPGRSWSSARTWCQQHYTDMVAIQNQQEIAYLNQLLPLNKNYYWIGIRKRNWAAGEPNNLYEDCVEMYIRRDIDTAKWNDERCLKRKGTVCYTASCSEGSCGIHADCVETIGNHTCQCHPGFLSPPCEEAVTCDSLWDPEHGRLRCSDSYGPFQFNSSCWFQCDHGYRLEGRSARLQCQASGRWDRPAPVCRVERCPALNRTSDRLLMNCSHPIAHSSFNSTCEFSCEEGFQLSGQSWTECDHAGQWTAHVPTCSVIACAPVSPPAMGNMTCVDGLAPFSFGSWCSFTCSEGYALQASNSSPLACLASAQWSQPTPTCEVVRCGALHVPPHATVGCQDPVGASSYGSTCAVRCGEGFNLIGSNTTQCSAWGGWSRGLPVCQAVRCRALSAPPHGALSCSDPHGPFSFSSRCALTCDEGFFLPNGTAQAECSSLGAWSQGVPPCLAVRCRALSAPPHGALSCSDPHGPFSFSSRCALTCDEGFFLPNGTAQAECSSLGAWSQGVPPCLAVRCRALSAPPHGALSCSDPHGPFSFSSRCALTCDEGFFLPNGTAQAECSSLGAWSQGVPPCLAVRCRALSAPPHGALSCSDPHGPFSFSSRCALTCDEGFFLPNGTAQAECSSLGAWSQGVPPCLAVRCRALSAPPHGALSCSDPHGPFSFSSRCALTCDEGFFLPNGTAQAECSSLGAWSQGVPPCLARSCPLLADAPHRGRMNCSHPHAPFSYGSRCDIGCSEGFRLSGAPSIHCNASGRWSGEMPTCQVVQCEAGWAAGLPPVSSPLSHNCSHPLGNFSYGSRCRFSCEAGHFLNGTEELLCSADGLWSSTLPTCAEESMPLWSAVRLYSGGTAASLVVLLSAIALGLLVARHFRKKKGILDVNNSFWEERENPAYES